MKKRKTPARRKARKPGVAVVPASRDPLLPQQRAFVLEYLSNRGNATRAYLASHPACTSYGSASTSGFKLLRNSKIQAEIEKVNGERWKRILMGPDEALALIAYPARADIADAFDAETGAMIPVHEWPDELRLSVKGIKANGDIVLHDGLKARELIAQSHGLIRSAVDHLHKFDHAKYLTDGPDE